MLGLRWVQEALEDLWVSSTALSMMVNATDAEKLAAMRKAHAVERMLRVDFGLGQEDLHERHPELRAKAKTAHEKDSAAEHQPSLETMFGPGATDALNRVAEQQGFGPRERSASGG